MNDRIRSSIDSVTVCLFVNKCHFTPYLTNRQTVATTLWERGQNLWITSELPKCDQSTVFFDRLALPRTYIVTSYWLRNISSTAHGTGTLFVKSLLADWPGPCQFGGSISPEVKSYLFGTWYLHLQQCQAGWPRPYWLWWKGGNFWISWWIFLDFCVIVLGFFWKFRWTTWIFLWFFFLFFIVSLKCKEMESANVLFLNFPMAYYWFLWIALWYLGNFWNS